MGLDDGIQHPKTTTRLIMMLCSEQPKGANVLIISQISRRGAYLKSSLRCSNASPAGRSQHLTHSSSAASRTLCSCSPADAARAHFCYTCWRHQIRGSRQLATGWGSSSGLSSHLMYQTALRHPWWARPLGDPNWILKSFYSTIYRGITAPRPSGFTNVFRCLWIHNCSFLYRIALY